MALRRFMDRGAAFSFVFGFLCQIFEYSNAFIYRSVQSAAKIFLQYIWMRLKTETSLLPNFHLRSGVRFSRNGKPEVKHDSSFRMNPISDDSAFYRLCLIEAKAKSEDRQFVDLNSNCEIKFDR